MEFVATLKCDENLTFNTATEFRNRVKTLPQTICTLKHVELCTNTAKPRYNEVESFGQMFGHHFS